MNPIAILGHELNNRISSLEKRPGITQILAPFYYDDGDMQEVYIIEGAGPGTWILSDFGMTLMRLSYTFDTLQEGRQALIEKIVVENGLRLIDGRIEVEANPKTLFYNYMDMNRAISQISGLRYQKQHRTVSTFLEDVLDGLMERLSPYHPTRDYYPIKDRDDLRVDINLPMKKPFFIYAAREDERYLRAGLTCSQLTVLGVRFRSIILIESEQTISSANWKSVTNIVDKQFVGETEILSAVPDYIAREIA